MFNLFRSYKFIYYQKNKWFFNRILNVNTSEDMAEVFSFLVYDKKKVNEKLINDAILKNKTSFLKIIL